MVLVLATLAVPRIDARLSGHWRTPVRKRISCGLGDTRRPTSADRVEHAYAQLFLGVDA